VIALRMVTWRRCEASHVMCDFAVKRCDVEGRCASIGLSIGLGICLRFAFAV
jgi:hypothetical protein